MEELTSQGVVHAVVGDVVGDGDLDALAASGSGGSNVSVLANNGGSGTFSPSQYVAVGAGPWRQPSATSTATAT
jgi:hypothetical protein